MFIGKKTFIGRQNIQTEIYESSIMYPNICAENAINVFAHIFPLLCVQQSHNRKHLGYIYNVQSYRKPAMTAVENERETRLSEKVLCFALRLHIRSYTSLVLLTSHTIIYIYIYKAIHKIFLPHPHPSPPGTP